MFNKRNRLFRVQKENEVVTDMSPAVCVTITKWVIEVVKL